MMSEKKISFEVNGKTVSVDRSPHRNLLYVLREDLGLTGAKKSCDQDGTCGSCMVIVDGDAVPSCKLQVSEMEDRQVETIEALSADGDLHPVQKAFVLKHVMQCGYATPGQIMSAKALLDKNPSPTAEEVAAALHNNISRCSAGYRAVDATMLAAAHLRGEQELEWEENAEARERRAIGKTSGDLKYTGDLEFPGMLYGRAKRSDMPHAKLLKVDIDEALKMPGVEAVFTAKDVPGQNLYGLLVADQPVFCDKLVRMVGDCIALVVADAQAHADAALEKIKVEYDPLPLLSDPREAIKPDAIQLHFPDGDVPVRENNILWEGHLRKGDPKDGIKEADFVIEQDYYTPFQEHGYEELECSIGVPEDDGVVVYCGSQGPTFDQEQIAPVLGLPLEKVRVAHMPTGGAFGGKEDVNTQIQAGLAAFILQKPVKVQFTRSESLRASHKRHAEFMHYKSGVTKDGRVVSLEATLYGDTGAYASTGEAVMFRSMTFAGGPYEVPHINVDSYAVHTNNVTCGAFRGFGNPQPTFASGVHMEKMARAIGMDSFEFRIKNALTVGRSTHTGQVISKEVGDGVKQCLEAVQRGVKNTKLPELGPDEKIGIGVAGCYKNVGLGGGIPDAAGAKITLQKDGTFLLQVGAADMGQGSYEAMRNIAAETLGIDWGLVDVHIGDTRHDPHGGMSTASRQTFVSGNATLKASEDLLKKIKGTVVSEYQIPESAVELGDANIVRSDTGEKLVSLKEFAEDCLCDLVGEAQYDAPETTPVPEWASPVPTQEEIDNNTLHFAYSFGAQASIVIVNEKTGEFKVHKVIAAFDAGKAINRPGVEGQIEGGVIQGLGYATTENYHLIDCIPQVTTYEELRLPRTDELPEIESYIIEEPHPYGPLGGKGMGEMPLSAAAPSVANAIYDAVGVWIHELPITKEKVLAALKNK